MLLDLNTGNIPMKRVYELSEELRQDPEQVALTQALTRDASRPAMGLKGSLGLYASEEWWSNVRSGRMPLLRISGIIERAFVSGQDPSDVNNTVQLRLADGSRRYDGIYTNDPKDVALFRPGSRMDIVYARDELKRSPSEQPSYLDIALEVAVSTGPVPA